MEAPLCCGDGRSVGPSLEPGPRGAAMMAPASPRAGGGKVFFNKQRTDSAENIPTEMIQFHL